MLGLTPISELRTVSSLASDELEVDEGGDFVLTLGPEEVDGNWLKLDPDAYIVVVRRLVSDWQKTDEGDWEVLNLTTLGQGSAVPDAGSVKQMLSSAANQTRTLREMLTIAHRLSFQLALSPNEVSNPRRAIRITNGGSLPSQLQRLF